MAKYLQARGWLVGSRRHIGGAGDLLAIRGESERRLLEVKADKKSPWQNFRKGDRQALIFTAREFNAEPLLAWSPTPSDIRLVPPKDWP